MIIAFCNKCQKDKEFSANKGHSKGRSCFCKDCMKIVQAAWYKKHRLEHIKRVANYKRSVTLFIRQLKSNPCLDCHNNFPYYVMDFDHVRGKKLFNIAASEYDHGIDVIKTEIAKCDLVCSNCHRIRTYNRRAPSLTVKQGILNPKSKGSSPLGRTN